MIIHNKGLFSSWNHLWQSESYWKVLGRILKQHHCIMKFIEKIMMNIWYRKFWCHVQPTFDCNKVFLPRYFTQGEVLSSCKLLSIEYRDVDRVSLQWKFLNIEYFIKKGKNYFWSIRLFLILCVGCIKLLLVKY